MLFSSSVHLLPLFFLFFFFNDTATTEIYTLSLHDALPISRRRLHLGFLGQRVPARPQGGRSEEHTSELQSLRHLVCRLLLEKKNYNIFIGISTAYIKNIATKNCKLYLA